MIAKANLFGSGFLAPTTIIGGRWREFYSLISCFLQARIKRQSGVLVITRAR